MTVLDAAVRPFWPHREYRDSGVDWLGALPEQWRVKRFGYLLERNDSGVWGDEGGPEDTLVLRSTDMTVDGRWHLSDPERRLLSVRDRSNTELLEGDIVLTKSSGSQLHLGKSAIVDGWVANLNACFSNFMQRLRCSSELEPKFTWYFLNARPGREQLLYRGSTTTGLANLNGHIVGATLVPLPPLPEQRAISAFLDRETAKIDNLIAKKERLIALLQEQRAAVITHAVTRGLDPAALMRDSGVEWLGQVPKHWGMTRLKRVTDAIVDCPHSTPVYSAAGEFPVIRTSDVSPGVLSLQSSLRVSEEEYRKRVERLTPRGGDILYSREGERFGIAALVPAGVQACLGQRMMHFRSGRRSDPAFLMWQLNAHPTYDQARLDSTGATSPHVNVDTIRNFRISLPPLAEQEAIACEVQAVSRHLDELQALVVTASDRLREYRSALISAAVTGKIDVRGEVE